MSHRLVRSRIAVLVLALALVAPWTAAAQPRHRAERSTKSFSVPAPWDLLAMLRSFLSSLQTDNGCSLDPFGRCIDQPATTTSDNGCSADPFGRCIGQSSTSGVDPALENGCDVDPNGRCVNQPRASATPRSYQKAGCQVDPNGNCVSGH